MCSGHRIPLGFRSRYRCLRDCPRGSCQAWERIVANGNHRLFHVVSPAVRMKIARTSGTVTMAAPRIVAPEFHWRPQEGMGDHEPDMHGMCRRKPMVEPVPAGLQEFPATRGPTCDPVARIPVPRSPAIGPANSAPRQGADRSSGASARSFTLRLFPSPRARRTGRSMPGSATAIGGAECSPGRSTDAPACIPFPRGFNRDCHGRRV